MIVGRSLELGQRPVFDDGDEVVQEGEDGLPSTIMVGDHSGAFGEYKLPLETFAAHYARPINTRDHVVPDPREFATAYLAAFRDQFLHIQGDYRKRRRAFDTLFKHCKHDPAGSFAYRWECVLRRLDQTEVDSLVAGDPQPYPGAKPPRNRKRPAESGHENSGACANYGGLKSATWACPQPRSCKRFGLCRTYWALDFLHPIGSLRKVSKVRTPARAKWHRVRITHSPLITETAGKGYRH